MRSTWAVVVALSKGVAWLVQHWREVATGVAGVAAVLLLPVTITAGVTLWVAWHRGWSPVRARWVVLGAWSLPLTSWVLGLHPGQMLTRAYDLSERWPSALVTLLPLIVALGVTQGAVMWTVRWHRARHGEIATPRAAGMWSHRQWQHGMRRARSEARRPGLNPPLTWGGDPVLGRAATITEGAGRGSIVPADLRRLVVPYEAIRRHLLVVGEPGAGKTVLLIRLMWGWLQAAWRRHILGAAPRPLLILLDCKGGRDGRDTAERLRRAALGMGIPRGRIGLWPHEVRLDLWNLPPDRLIEVLVDMVKAEHPFYDAMRDELVALAVLAPHAGPPKHGPDFIHRLNGKWLLANWGPEHPGEQESIRQNAQHFAGIAATYRGLFRRIGRALDGGRALSDLDVVVATLEGTANTRTAAAQAQALVELVTDLAVRSSEDERRQVLLVIDEFSAVSDRVDIAVVMERVRSLGVAVVVAGQSWASLGADNDQRRRLRAAAAGGLLLMSTSDPDELAASGGTQIVVEAGTKRLAEGGWGDEGTARAQRAQVVDPDWVRALGVHPGQVAYVSAGTATWGVVAPADEGELTGPVPALLGGGLRAAIEAHRTSAITRGPRVPVAELEGGLDWLEQQARRGQGMTGAASTSTRPGPVGVPRFVPPARPAAVVPETATSTRATPPPATSGPATGRAQVPPRPAPSDGEQRPGAGA